MTEEDRLSWINALERLHADLAAAQRAVVNSQSFIEGFLETFPKSPLSEDKKEGQ